MWSLEFLGRRCLLYGEVSCLPTMTNLLKASPAVSLFKVHSDPYHKGAQALRLYNPSFCTGRAVVQMAKGAT